MLAETAVGKLLANAGRSNAEISLVLVDDPRIQELNRLWRGINSPTDVLSWPQEEPPPMDTATVPDILGDVVISRDTALRQATARQWTLEEECALLLVHGTLHLLGYEDETEEGAEAMRQLEAQLLGRPLEKVAGDH